MNEEEQAPPQQEAASASVGPSPSEGVAAPEISRRVGSILDAVEREAARLREEARVEATGYLDNARRRADGLVAERQRRIGELSDELIAKSEAVIARLDDAAPVRMGFENLVRALGDAAERLANEAETTASDFEPPPFGTGAVQPAAAPQPGPAPGYPGYAPYSPPGQEQQPPQGEIYPPAAPAAHSPYAPDPAGSPYAQPQQPNQAQQYESAPHPARAPSSPGWLGDGVDRSVEPSGPAQPLAAQPSAQPAVQGGGSGWRSQDEARMVAIQMAATGATRGTVREHLHRTLGLHDTGGVLDEIFGPGSGEEAQVPWTSARR